MTEPVFSNSVKDKTNRRSKKIRMVKVNDGHVDESCNAFVSPYESKILYKKGETLPILGGCSHWIRWKLIEVYT